MKEEKEDFNIEVPSDTEEEENVFVIDYEERPEKE